MSGIQGISNSIGAFSAQSTGNTEERSRFYSAAASVLGISSDELKNKLQSGSDIQSIVKERGMTTEDFNQKMGKLRENGQAGGSKNAPPPPPPPQSGKGVGAEQFITDASNVLGISSDDLKTKIDSGSSLQSIVEEKGLTKEDFQQQMIALFNNNQSANNNQTGNIVNQLV